MRQDPTRSTPENYLETLSLHCAPFADDDGDGRFFYGGTALMQRLDLLTHLTQFGDSVVLVAGPEGSGKSTMLRRFVNDAGGRWRLCLLDGTCFSEFPRRLADALGVDAPGSEAEMVDRWASATDHSRLLVIIIDNAEQLDESAFRRLCTLLKQPFAERLRLVMFGTPEAQQRLRQALENQALDCTTQFLEVPRLSEEETASYLMYRLAVAGYSGESPFTATEVRAICKAADGRPAAVNRLAHESLLERQARLKSKRLRQPARLPRIGGSLWAGASLLVLLLAVYLGWQRYYAADSDSAAPPAMEEIPLALPESTPPQAPAAPAPQPAPAPAAPGPTPPPEESEPPPPRTLPGSMAQAPATPEPAGAATTEASNGDVPPAAETAAEEKGEPAPDKGAGETVPSAAAGTAAPESGPAPRPETPSKPETTTAPPAAPTAAETLPHREEWLLEQPKDSFSLQLLGSRNEQSLLDFIAANKLDRRQTAYYRGKYKGADWYVLLYGSYPGRQAALDARRKLPARVRQGKPWPRSLESVQQAIRENR